MKKLIIGNWKMNGSISFVDVILESIKSPDVVIAMPNIFLAYANSKCPKFKLAAQDCSTFDNFGAHTGEVSAHMLASTNCKYVILGHSERRSTFEHDNVANILIKLNNVISNNMKAILCVDENYEALLDAQTLSFIEAHRDDVILAYEPLSAIGTGKTLSTAEIAHTLSELKAKYNNIQTIYGGSVNPGNIADILSIEFLDGVLVGGASLKLNDFQTIIAAAG